MKKRISGIAWLSIFLLAGTLASASRAAAQKASIEFVAQATPSDGLEEPVRGFPFFLLSKSFAEIGKEVEAGYPKPDMDAFIDKLDLTKELRAWMKKHDWVMLSGEEFIHKLHADDISERPGIQDGVHGPKLRRSISGFPEAQVQSLRRKEKPGEIQEAL